MNTVAGAALLVALLLPAADAIASPQRTTQPARRDSARIFDANEIRLPVTNFGGLGIAYYGGPPYGLEWPKGSASAGYTSAGGLWLGARVNGDTLVAVAEYTQEFAAGPLGPTGAPVDPTESDPAHHVYRIRRGDNAASNPDYANWPAALGAPVDALGQPRVLGDQTLWCVYNDAIASRHMNPAGSTAPLGIEVRQTVFGFERGGPLGRTVFLRFDLHNPGTNLLEETYVGLWLDADLRGSDLAGCDSTSGLGFMYAGREPPSGSEYEDYEVPAIGTVILQGPIVAGDTLGMTSFARIFQVASDPERGPGSYRRLAGAPPGFLPGTCGDDSRFEVSGDPVLGTGCLDASPSDRRYLLGTGPFTLAPGDSQHVVMALVVGGRPGDPPDRLRNLRWLQQFVLNARDAWVRGFQNVESFPECDPGPLTYYGAVQEPVRFDAGGSADEDGSIVSYAWDFGDGSPAGSGAAVEHVYAAGGRYLVTLTVTDDQGHSVAAPTFADIYDPAGLSTGFADSTVDGLAGVRYLNAPNTSRTPYAGIAWGGRFFGGGLDTGCRWSGSSIVGTTDDLARCPSAALAPDRFKTVELRFDGTQLGYRYLRRELVSGAPPAVGRGYDFIGRSTVPFTAWGIEGGLETQLEVLFTERQVTDDTGAPVGTQPASQNAFWQPTAEDSGGFELLSIVDLPFSPAPRAELAQNGVFFSGALPILHGGWVRQRASFDAADPVDRLRFDWVALGDGSECTDAVWGDADGDGMPDLYVARLDARSRLFTRTEGGGWSEQRLPPSVPSSGQRAGWVDFDNDGDLDLFRAFLGAENQLLRNDGDSLAIVSAPALSGSGATLEAAWADLDHDGDLDVLLCNATGGNRLVLNHRDGGFTDVTPAALAGDGIGRWGDADGDGDPDLFLARDGAPDRLLRYDGDLTFVEVSAGPILDTGNGGDAAWGDFDNDGDLDLYVSNEGGSRVLRNDGGLAFAQVLADPQGGAGRWVDFDGDGHLDVVVPGPSVKVLRNQGDGTFADASAVLAGHAAEGVADADYDVDGDLDLYLVSPGSGNRLLANQVMPSRYLRLDLRGQASNRYAVGARVRVTAHGETQTRELGPFDPPGALVFGLGGAAMVDEVEIRWPSGLVERRANVPLFSSLALEEGNVVGASPPARLAFGRVIPNPGAGIQIFEVRIPVASSFEPALVKLTIYDVAGRRVRRLEKLATSPGTHLMPWNGRDDDGREVPAAVYFARVSGPTGSASRRFVRLR